MRFLFLLFVAVTLSACLCDMPPNDPPTPPQLITCAAVGCSAASRVQPVCTSTGCTCTQDSGVYNCLPDCQGVCADKTQLACDAQGCACESRDGYVLDCTP